MTTAIILAGGKKTGIQRDNKEPLDEALIPIGNRYMVEYVVDALLGSQNIERVIISGPVKALEEKYKEDPRITLVKNGERTIDTLYEGLRIIKPPQLRVLIVTADIPLLTTQAVDDFLDSCKYSEGDLFYPVVPKKISEGKYPGIKRTYVRLREGSVTGGNMFLLNTYVFSKCARRAQELIDLRKKPLRLASHVGLDVLLRYILGILSLKEAEKKVSSLLGIKGVVVVSNYAEVGIDVDKSSDFKIAQKALGA